MHTNSRLLFEKYAKSYFRSGVSVLEVGPGSMPSEYQTCVADSSITWHTLDMKEDAGLTYCSKSEYEFPVQSDRYDIVLSGQVIEHVRKIWVWIREVARVCKPNGLVITINPVSWPFHEAPVDCWRIFPDGMKALYDHASLNVELSTWDSLEGPRYRRRIPGRSAEWQPPRLRRVYAILGTLGLPVECAYDTITVGRKATS